MKHIIKQSGSIEVYSAHKHKKSIQRSLYAVHASNQDLEEICAAILRTTEIWLADKPEVSYKDIRIFTTNQLKKHNADAAIVYKNHKDIW